MSKSRALLCEGSQAGVNKLEASAFIQAGVVKRSNTADCKSAGLCLRGFESLPLHQTGVIMTYSGVQKTRSHKRRHSPLPTDTPDISELLRIDCIDPDTVRGALLEARSQDPDEFRKKEHDWLVANLAPLSTAIEKMFEVTIKERGPELAEAALLGSYLGGSVIRKTIDDGAFTVDKSLINLYSWNSGVRPILYDPTSPVTKETLVQLFGTQVAIEFGEIRHDASRTMSALVVSMAFEPKPNS